MNDSVNATTAKRNRRSALNDKDLPANKRQGCIRIASNKTIDDIPGDAFPSSPMSSRVFVLFQGAVQQLAEAGGTSPQLHSRLGDMLADGCLQETGSRGFCSK